MKTKTIVAGALIAFPAATTLAQDGSAESDIYGIYAPPLFVTQPVLAEPEVYPLTPEARQTHNEYVYTPPLDDCEPIPMPQILWVGSPMRIERNGDALTFQFERADTVRTIHMTEEPAPANLPHSELGYSIGRWVGNVLTIETTHLLPGYLHRNNGTPMSIQTSLTERYWREPGELDLQLEVIVNDPVNYTETFAISREWIWAPDEEIKPWGCFDLTDHERDVDLEELIRQLEALD